MNAEQHEIYEYARKRIAQKKRFYFHFFVFFTTSVFLFILNKWVGIGKEYHWHLWATLVWLFLVIIHFIQVFIIESFMNKKWEREQIDRLMAMQQKKLEQLKNELENQKK